MSVSHTGHFRYSVLHSPALFPTFQRFAMVSHFVYQSKFLQALVASFRPVLHEPRAQLRIDRRVPNLIDF